MHCGFPRVEYRVLLMKYIEALLADSGAVLVEDKSFEVECGAC